MKKPIFQRRHYEAVARTLGEQIGALQADGVAQANNMMSATAGAMRVVYAFDEMFRRDNRHHYDSRRFKDAVANTANATIFSSNRKSAV